MWLSIHASLDLVDSIRKLASSLGGLNVGVILPDLRRYQHIRDELGDIEGFNRIKARLAREAVADISGSDGLIVINEPHRGIEGYVGGQSFFKMSLAFAHDLPIIVTNVLPEGLPYSEELEAFRPEVIPTSEPERMMRYVGDWIPAQGFR